MFGLTSLASDKHTYPLKTFMLVVGVGWCLKVILVLSLSTSRAIKLFSDKPVLIIILEVNLMD